MICTPKVRHFWGVYQYCDMCFLKQCRKQYNYQCEYKKIPGQNKNRHLVGTQKRNAGYRSLKLQEGNSGDYQNRQG